MRSKIRSLLPAAIPFLLIILLSLCHVNAFAATYGTSEITLKTVGSPSVIERLKESTKNRSFSHKQKIPGENEYEDFFFTTKSAGWVGFAKTYHSDVDSAGGVRPQRVYLYADRNMTKLIDNNFTKGLLEPGTYYIRVYFKGSYDFYGYLLPCKNVLSASMVIDEPQKAYARVNGPDVKALYYLAITKPDHIRNFNTLNTRLYLQSSNVESKTYKSYKYYLYYHYSEYSYFQEKTYDSSHPYYLYVYYPSMGSEWYGWWFYVPVKINADLSKTPRSIKSAVVTGVQSPVVYNQYSKTPRTFSIKVTLGKKELKVNTDYTVTYKNNDKIGRASVIIKGKGLYSGTITKYFTINPPAPYIYSLVNYLAGSRGFRAAWDKVAPDVTAYQIQYSTVKSFSKNRKTKTFNGANVTGCWITGLKSKKTYYVRVRAYKKTSTKTYYSAWSSVRSITLI